MTKFLYKLLPESLFTKLRSAKNRRRKSLSQIGQDFWVMGEAFNGKENGFFLELGSADGIALNNTFLLEKRCHWKGICIEANPESFQILVQVRQAKCVNVCIDESEGELEFIQDGLFSRIVDNKADLPDDNAKERKTIRIRSRPLVSILRENGAPNTIDYLSIDVEGVEERVLAGFPFAEYRFLTLTIERPTPKLRSVLGANGYLLVKELHDMDCFYIHESFLSTYKNNAFDFWGRYRS